jgi:hypothetical protein
MLFSKINLLIILSKALKPLLLLSPQSNRLGLNKLLSTAIKANTPILTIGKDYINSPFKSGFRIAAMNAICDDFGHD